jgi:hypothetical protein
MARRSRNQVETIGIYHGSIPDGHGYVRWQISSVVSAQSAVVFEMTVPKLCQPDRFQENARRKTSSLALVIRLPRIQTDEPLEHPMNSDQRGEARISG